MDSVALIFYAGVCGLLGMVAPNLGGRMTRLMIGAAVGIVAAAILPSVRLMFG